MNAKSKACSVTCTARLRQVELLRLIYHNHLLFCLVFLYVKQ